MVKKDDVRTQSIQLQGVGRVRAKRADQFRIGEFFVWNYGSESKIIGIKKVTKTQIVFITQTRDGRKWERRLKKDRLVGIGGGF